MNKLLLKGVFLLLTVLLIGCDQDKKDEPSTNEPSQGKLSVRFIEKTNCPVAYIEDSEVWENEIYCMGQGSFFKYSPSDNRWTELCNTPSNPKTLFVYQGCLYCFAGGDVYLYNKDIDSWSDAGTKIVDANEFAYTFVTNYKVVCGKLYAHDSMYDLYYNAANREWEEIGQTNFFDTDVVSIGKYGYYDYSEILNKFNTDTNTRQYLNWSTPSFTWAQAYDFDMATNYGQDEVLFLNFEEYFSGIELHLGIYNPELNKIWHYYFYNFSTADYPQIFIPDAFNYIAKVNNRYFVGASNSDFYEMLISE